MSISTKELLKEVIGLFTTDMSPSDVRKKLSETHSEVPAELLEWAVSAALQPWLRGKPPIEATKPTERKVDQDWIHRGQRIADKLSRQQWEIGDWLAEGCDKWERKAYAAAERIFPDYARTSLRNFVYVARVFPNRPPFEENETSRRMDVSWSHHQLIAGFKPDERKELLDYAAKKRLSLAGVPKALECS